MRGQRADWFDDELNVRRQRAACDELAERGLVAWVRADDAGETRRWLDLELASLVECHLHRTFDPEALTDHDREQLESRVTWQGRGFEDPHRHRRPAWLLEDGVRVGTIAFDDRRFGGPFLSVSSLFVRPERRERGVAGQALRLANEAMLRQGGAGVRLETSWCWPRSVRFYLGLGMWVWSWKHALGFVWSSDHPTWRIELEGDRARFVVREGQGWRVLLEAERRRERLAWRALVGGDEATTGLLVRSTQTFGVRLAVEGWPLLRAPDAQGDFGLLEQLAERIEAFEAVDRARGFEVRTPRLPGIPYRDLDAL